MLPLAIPQSHKDLIEGRSNTVLTTIMPDGQPQTTPVWCNQDVNYLFINTMHRFQKTKNMRTNPKVTLLFYDPHNPLHNMEIRGLVVDMTEEGALEHLNQLTSHYMDKPNAEFFGDSIPADLQTAFTPIKIKIAPTHIRVEG
jgi:PPOX class probable F420-dependent enzyme